VRLTVADNGSGMSEDTKAHLFEPFFTTKGRAHGTGLGLATVYGIVTQAGGAIVVHSTPGEGSTFDIYLPRTTEVVRTTTERTTPRPRGRERVLLVEDEEAVRELTAIILRRAGFTVFDAANPDDAVAAFTAQEGGIDALLTDVIMPGGTGPELFARLAARQPALRVLFMSGYTDAAVPPLLMAGENAVFVQKPFTAESLLQKLRDVLDR
jgi:CheY-like chemotaxis protein